MSRLRWLITGCALLLVVGACTTSSSVSTGPSGSVSASTGPSGGASTPALQGGGLTASATTPTPAPTPAATPTPTATQGAGGNPPAIDPCTLLTDKQASAVNGVTYGPGVSHVLGRLVECVWQSSSPHASVVVQVLVAPEATEAQTQYVASQAELHGFHLTKVPNFADEAVIARAPGGTISTGGIYVREGATFFDVVYLLGTAPSDDALKFAATLVLGNLP